MEEDMNNISFEAKDPETQEKTILYNRDEYRVMHDEAQIRETIEVCQNDGRKGAFACSASLTR